MLKLLIENILDREDTIMTEWKKIQLGNIIKMNENTYSPKENWKFINYLDTGNITTGIIDNIKYINLFSDKLPSRAKRKVKMNSIIYSTVRPNQLHYGIIKEFPDNFLVSTGFTVIDVDTEKALPDYIYYILTQKDVIEHLQAIAEQSVSAYPSIKPSDLENLEVFIPDIYTQIKVEAIISLIDQKIKKNREINNNLEQQAHALYCKFLSDKIINGVFKDIVIENKKSKIKVSEAQDINGEYPFFTSGKRILEYNSYLVDNRNIYLNTGGNADVKYYIGKASYSTDTWCITTKNNLTNYCYLFLKNIQNEIDAIYFEGSALKHLQKKKLLEKKIYIPNIQETQNLNEILDPLFEIISKNTFQNRYLSFLRDALLSKLMSGELDISEIDI